jgi:hypothetical protein
VLIDCVINAQTLDEDMIRLEQALPCLLHLENQTSEIEHLLRRDLMLHEGDKAATEERIAYVENLLNNEIYGIVGCSSLWTLPLNENGMVGKMKFANWRARHVVDSIEDIIRICFLLRIKWWNVISGKMSLICTGRP